MAVNTGKMEVAVRTAEGTYEVIEDDIPDIAPDQVLMEVRASGICGGDLHNWREPVDRLAGKRFGHEFSGEVAGVGGDVESIEIGDRVAFDPVINCGKCAYCRTGRPNICPDLIPLKVPFFKGFAQFVAVPEHTIYAIPDGLSFDAASVADPLAVAIRSVHRAGVKPGDTIAVIGMGTIGLMILQFAKLIGARVIALDIVDSHLEMARKMGAIETINNGTEDAKERVLELTGGFGADVVFEVVGGGAPTMQLAVALTRNGGAIGLVGVFIESLDNESMENVRRFEKELIGIASCSYWGNRTEFGMALDAMESGEVDVNSLITHRFPLGQINDAFDTAKNPLKTGAIKVLVIP